MFQCVHLCFKGLYFDFGIAYSMNGTSLGTPSPPASSEPHLYLYLFWVCRPVFGQKQKICLFQNTQSDVCNKLTKRYFRILVFQKIKILQLTV